MQIQADMDVETSLLGPVLQNRSCGECTVCCTTLKVDTPDFKKPAETPCKNLDAQGCVIHAVRPLICRTWFCGWRRVATMPDDARPDRSGLLVSLNFMPDPRNCFEGVAINVRLLAGSTAIEDGAAAKILDSLCDRLVPVWFSDGAKKMLMHPDNDVAGYVISGSPPPLALQDEVQAWRRHYGLFAPSDPDPKA